MPWQSTVYDVLIASPSDVHPHREQLARVVREWNSSNSRNRGVVLRELRWELDSALGLGATQPLINKQLVKRADILIGLFWTRLGTPTLKGVSGTAEEISQFCSDQKHVILLFSKADLPFDYDREQFDKLKEYRNSLRGEVYYGSFSKWDELPGLAKSQLDKKMDEICLGAGSHILAPDDGAIVQSELEVTGRVAFLNPDEQAWLVVQIENGWLYPQAPLRFDARRRESFMWREKAYIGTQKPGGSQGQTFIIKLVAAGRESNYEFEKYCRGDGDRKNRLPRDWPTDFRELARVSVIRGD